MNIQRKWALCVCVLACLPLVAQDLERDFSRAARGGDADAVRSLLEQGVDVNTKFRYEATALAFACDRGHVEVVRILLEHGADVNAKDTFYGAIPLGWAISPPSKPSDRRRHNQIVDLLLAKGAGGEDGPGRALQTGVGSDDAELVRIALSHGGDTIPAEKLTQALIAAAENGRIEIAELLREAGAVPLVEKIVELTTDAMQRYTGHYRDGRGYLWRIEVKEGKLFATYERGGEPLELLALGDGKFRAKGSATTRIGFQEESGKVAVFVLETPQGKQTVERVKNMEEN